MRAAKQRDDGDLADAIAALRKPTAAARVLNSFARVNADEIDAVLDVGARLREAVDRGDGDEIRAVMRERMQTVVETMRAIRRHVDELREPLSAPVVSQVEQSLRAAMTSEDDAVQLRRGVLAAALSDRGIEAMREPTERGEATKPDNAKERPDRDDEVAAARSRRQAAEERASAAAEAVERIRRELDDTVSQRSELEHERQTLRTRLVELEQQLDRAHDAESDLESQLRDARQQLRNARSAARRRR